MKCFTLVAAFFVSTACFGQTQPHLKAELKFKLDSNGNSLLKSFPSAVMAPGIHFLPQDNMPCVVPDTREIVPIPNGWKGEISPRFNPPAPAIPNPGGKNSPQGKTFQITPLRPLLQAMPQKPPTVIPVPPENRQ
jgi:hypothetical protein